MNGGDYLLIDFVLLINLLFKFLKKKPAKNYGITE